MQYIMIIEGMNININDIEDDDLRKKVIKYFKTFKKGKLEDEDLSETEDDEEKKDDKEKNENSEDDLKNENPEDLDIDDDDVADYLNDEPEEKKKVVDAVRDSEMSDDKKKQILDLLGESVSESLINEGKGYGKAALIGGLFMGIGAIPSVVGLAIVRHSIKKSVKKTEQTMKDLIDRTDDPKMKKRLKQDLQNYQASVRDENGEILCSKQAREKNIKKLKKSGSLPKDYDIQDIKTTKQYVKQCKKYVNSKEREITADDIANAIKSVKNDAKKIKSAIHGDEPEKDSEGNVLKQEEITDKDGKKKKVTTHTGPRGGKFYWPDGSPKDAEHKVYIGKDGKVKECMDLRDYLCESFK